MRVFGIYDLGVKICLLSLWNFGVWMQFLKPTSWTVTFGLAIFKILAFLDCSWAFGKKPLEKTVLKFSPDNNFGILMHSQVRMEFKDLRLGLHLTWPMIGTIYLEGLKFNGYMSYQTIKLWRPHISNYDCRSKLVCRLFLHYINIYEYSNNWSLELGSEYIALFFSLIMCIQLTNKTQVRKLAHICIQQTLLYIFRKIWWALVYCTQISW